MIDHIDASTIAEALGGRRNGSGWIARCPAHADRTPSLSINDGNGGRPLLFCHAGCQQGHVIDALRHRGLWAEGARHHSPTSRLPSPRPATRLPSAQRTERALSIWEQALPPAGTPVEIYLAKRGLMLPDVVGEQAIRFHPQCPFGTAVTPAMVALIRDIRTDESIGIHKTALDREGNKIEIAGLDRRMAGRVAGGAVKLTDDGEVTIYLGIGEGIESVLSMRLLPEFGNSPAWALLSANQVAAFPVLAGIECLWIAVDNDAAGIAASKAVAARWRDAGREVFCIQPIGIGADLNDILKVAA
jgi:putative DNA primase/helicase